MDITTDGFGWMLAFGDLAWVPFSYSLQARYIVENDPSAEMSPARLVGIFALNFVGYWIFRGSNSEKDAFRRDPTSEEVAHLKTLETQVSHAKKHFSCMVNRLYVDWQKTDREWMVGNGSEN